MNFTSDSKLVRWAYYEESVPSTTNVCALFWRSVLLTPLKLLPMILIFVVVPIVFVWMIFKSPNEALIFGGIIVGTTAILMGIGWLLFKLHNLAVEKGFCRKVTIDDI